MQNVELLVHMKVKFLVIWEVPTHFFRDWTSWYSYQQDEGFLPNPLPTRTDYLCFFVKCASLTGVRWWLMVLDSISLISDEEHFSTLLLF